VESAGQALYLRERGVDQAQGWYYSRALPAAEFIEFIQRFNSPGADNDR
jgi:sensor c-di-GMP phosphodiesterase-like protein